MFSLLAISLYIFKTYFESLKRDLVQIGYKKLSIICIINFVGHPILLAVLIVLGKFRLPSDPLFYLFWFGVVVIALVQFVIYLKGLSQAKFFAANTLYNLQFIVATLYAVLLLREIITTKQIIALFLATVGAVILLFPARTKNRFKWDKGLILVFVALLIYPLGVIFYKISSQHASTYSIFLSGRLIMDLVYYSLFYFGVFKFWHKTNPIPELKSILLLPKGLVYVIGLNIATLVESWLIFVMPISWLVVLGTIAIPTGYFLDKIKYKEKVSSRAILAALIIITAIIIFALSSTK